MRDLIFISLEDWDDIWRRNQFVCATLARRFPDIKILFVGQPRDVPNLVRRGQWSEFLKARTTQVPGLPNLTVTNCLKLLPDSVGPTRRLNHRFARSHIRRLAASLEMRDPILWLNPCDALHMIGRMRESATVYDITDDWTLASFPPRLIARIRELDRRMCLAADLVVVCSKALAQSRREGCRRLLLLPNGVEGSHYRSVLDHRPGSSPARWPGPVFGYTGTLHVDRVDVDLILKLAAANPQGTVALVGPDSLTPALRDRLRRRPNIVLHGPVRYADIPATMAQFDVLIVPHVRSAFTESLNPIKLWEYLASGKPIVSSDIAGFRDFPHLCRIAADDEDFIRHCAAARNDGAAHAPLRIAEAAKHSWEQRVDQLLAEFQTAGMI